MIARRNRSILADAFALYLKTKNFHWHRKIGGTTLRSIGQISKLQTIKDNDETFVPAHDMLRELMNDNKHVAASMRECHELAEKHDDAATAGLLENFIDGTERRTWFLFEASRDGHKSGR